MKLRLQMREMAKKFNRSHARITEILIELKKENKATNYRVGSLSYWIRNDKNITIISSVKQKYIELLKKQPKTTAEIAHKLHVDSKGSLRRLHELKRLGLVRREKDKKWALNDSDSEVIVIAICGIDEAGREL